MDTATPKPRINGSMVAKNIGKYVSLVGKNIRVNPGGNSMIVETSDGQKITAKFPQPLRDSLDPYVEVLGRVEQDCSITVERISNFGTNFDLPSYNEVVKLSMEFPQIFRAQS